MANVVSSIAKAVKLRPEQVEGAVALIRDGATLPFIARYRKDRTGNLGEGKLRAVQERLREWTELEARRSVVLNSIQAQGPLDPALRAKIEAAVTRSELEDLYLPYSPRPKKTPAGLAREQGLAPLAELILKQEPDTGKVDARTVPFLSAEKGVKDSAAALAGAREIIAERFSEDPELRTEARKRLWAEGRLTAKARPGVVLKKTKYAEWAACSEALSKFPPSRFLKLWSAEAEGKVEVRIEAPREKILERLRARAGLRAESIFHEELAKALESGLDRLLLPVLENEVRRELRARAEAAAAEHLARTLRPLLLQPPLGARRVLAFSPGRQRVRKLVVLDETGGLLASGEVQPEGAPEERERARAALAKLLKEHGVQAVALGGGPGGREADALVREVLAREELGGRVPCIWVNEAGIMAHANSRAVKKDFPKLDAAARAALGLGRRLQNPLAEWVKIPPKFLCAGPYPKDINTDILRRRAGDVLEYCVNRAGVDLNKADADLLQHVSGVGRRIARAIVEARAKHGPFPAREALKDVPGLGPRGFQMAAGFLRVRGGTNPLDATAIHPEHYGVVEKMARSLGLEIKDLAGQPQRVNRLKPENFQEGDAGAFTLRDICWELKHPGRDPRGSFARPAFDPAIKRIGDLKAGQVLNGLITHLTAFGVFVDLGVCQDGLVPVRELAPRFVRDPAALFSVGKAVRVKVVSVDLEKKRIYLSIKAVADSVETRRPRARAASGTGRTPAARSAAPRAPTGPAASAAGKAPANRAPRGGARERGARAQPTAAPSKPGLPDYSKFFVKKSTKRKGKREGGRSRGDEASRAEVHRLLRQQKKSAPTLGDLFKKAGLGTGEDQEQG